MVEVEVRLIVDELPDGFAALSGEARHEGHNHLDRLAQDWTSRKMRFDRPGERLLAGTVAEALVGVGGLSIEPDIPGGFRMRRFYVRRASRRSGVARAIASQLMQSLPPGGRAVTVNAGGRGAAAFWEALGFSRTVAAGHTHVIYLPPSQG